MPLYEYKCDSCGAVFEVLQKFSDSPVETHEKCGGHVERLLSAPTFQFKGSGWYVTDYAKGSGKSGANGGSKPASEAAKTTPEKKDSSKPASASPEKK